MVAVATRSPRTATRRVLSGPKGHARPSTTDDDIPESALYGDTQAGIRALTKGSQGWSGDVLRGGQFVGLEPNRDLSGTKWRGTPTKPGVGEQMWNDGACSAVYDEWIDTIVGAICEDVVITPGDPDDAASRMQAEFVRRMLFEKTATTKEQWVRVAASEVIWGCSLLEPVIGYDSTDETPAYALDGRHWVEQDRGDVGHYILEDLEPREPKAINRWLQDPDTGRFAGVEQWQRSDDTSRSGDKPTIPAENLCLFSFRGTGTNWEGRALLRPAYAFWKAREIVLKMLAMGAQRFGVGVPKLRQTVENFLQSKKGKEAWTAAKAMVADYRAGAKAWVALPYGLDLDILDTSLPAAKEVRELWLQLGLSIYLVAHCQHLVQGTQKVGTYDLQQSQTSGFRRHINPTVAGIIAELERKVVRPLIDLNWAEVHKYPILELPDQSEAGAKEQLEAYEVGRRAQVLSRQPDDEDWARSLIPGLPRMTQETEDAAYGGEPDEQDPEPDPDAADDIDDDDGGDNHREHAGGQPHGPGCSCHQTTGQGLRSDDGTSPPHPSQVVRALAEGKFDHRTSRQYREDATDRIAAESTRILIEKGLKPYLEQIWPLIEAGDSAGIAKARVPGKDALMRYHRAALTEVLDEGSSEVVKEMKRQAADEQWRGELAAALAELYDDVTNPVQLDLPDLVNAIDELVTDAAKLRKQIQVVSSTTADAQVSALNKWINDVVQAKLVTSSPADIEMPVLVESAQRTITSGKFRRGVAADVNRVHGWGRARGGREANAQIGVYTLNPEIGMNGPHEPCSECYAAATDPRNPYVVGSDAELDLQTPNPRCDSLLGGELVCWCSNIYLATDDLGEAAKVAGL